jgi:hypothetical protein
MTAARQAAAARRRRDRARQDFLAALDELDDVNAEIGDLVTETGFDNGDPPTTLQIHRRLDAVESALMRVLPALHQRLNEGAFDEEEAP